ncbi:MAG TPA: cellulase family glycosylhydrolase [Bryobacteraceae bacterium]|nr:cellulase family glycosylhydrolase [Bryobacteraceae bacterium]
MMRIPLILAALCAGLTSTAAAQYLRGVNISQAEWGDPISATYGSEYSYPSAPTFNYFAARALGFIRLQVQWERLQPALGGPLDSNNLAYLQQNVADAKAAGALVSIDPHNFARYAPTESQVANPCVIDNPCPGSPVNVTSADLADFWVKMSDVFKDEPAVVAYDLMNEPHDMGSANWVQIAQTVVSAIRANGDNKLIMIPGDGWSNATYWASYYGGNPLISDPANNYYYEAHLYFDHDFSGSYSETYDVELAANPQLAQVGVTRLAPFVSWCTSNHVPCYLGEYGIPSDDPRWLTVLDNFFAALDSAGMPGTYWAAGELWATAPNCTCSLLSVQPSNNFTADAEQLPTLLAHVQPGSFRTSSAAGSYGWASAPGELAAGYGQGLANGTAGATGSLTTVLQGAQVQIIDSGGSVSFAPLVYVSHTQINYQIPSGVAPGLASTQVVNNGNVVAAGVLEVQPLAPVIFSANYTGQGVAAAYIQRVHPDGTQSLEYVFTYDSGSGQNVAVPIAFDGDSLYLDLFGTGFDAASGAGGTTASIAGTPVSVAYSGWPGQFAGEDQIVIQLPGSLAGAGEVPIALTVDGIATNTVTLTFQ